MAKISFKIDEQMIENINETDDLYTYKLSSELGEYFRFGVCMSELLEFELNNVDDRFQNIKIHSKEISILKDDILQKKYYITDVSRENNKIKVKAYDLMIKLDKVWKEVRTPITTKNLLIETLQQVNISTVNNISFKNENYVIWDLSECKGKTCREVVSYILELGGTNARINSENKFELANFNEKEINVNVDNVLKLSTDDDYITVDNVSFFRSDMEYMKTNTSRTNYIKMVSNNPLVKICSGEKLQEIINKIDVNYTYIPSECEIIQSDVNFNVGDLLKIVYKNKDYIFYITKISYKNNNYLTISSSSVEGREDTESNFDKSMSMGGVNFYTTSTKTEIKLQDCSQSTKVYATLNFYSENEKYINLMINGKFNRQFKCSKGNNNIGNIIDYDFQDGVNTLNFSQMDSEDIENYSISLIYKNANICDVYEKDYDVNDTESPLNPQPIPEYEFSKIYGLMKLKSGVKLLVNSKYVGYNEKNKIGKDVVIFCEDGTVYINNEENNFELIIDDNHGNLITYSEEEIKEQNTEKRQNTDTYYVIEIPFSIGTITEYETKRYFQDEVTVGHSFIILNDDCVEIPENVLLNLTQQSYSFSKYNDEKIITSSRFEIGDRSEETEETLYITNGNRNYDVEIWQTKENKIYCNSSFWGEGGLIYDTIAGQNTELYKEFKNTKLYKIEYSSGFWAKTLHIDIDTISEISEKYNTEFYRYCIMTEQEYSRLKTQDDQ